MELLSKIKKYLHSTLINTYGKIITQEGNAYSGNDYFRITIRWTGKVRKRILKKDYLPNGEIRLVELTPLSKSADISIRHYNGYGTFTTNHFHLDKGSSCVKKDIFIRRVE